MVATVWVLGTMSIVDVASCIVLTRWAKRPSRHSAQTGAAMEGLAMHLIGVVEEIRRHKRLVMRHDDIRAFIEVPPQTPRQGRELASLVREEV